ncbi:hypothetical protein [Pandoraea sp. ISTKB]|uniref:hypothetical protein n=1 Tax=Pandoraea sp. ISTKB TaxID=1586708 RepID=UPI001112EAB0|nr:hypothetical protein [Pandoraea sp. ISTKB]
MEQIGDRLKLLISARTDDRLRYVQLETVTGISADRWKNFWFGRKRADAEMIEAASKAWPETAFWLACGATDVQFGHIAGNSENTFPEAPLKQSMPATAEYLRASVRARDCAQSLVNRINDERGGTAPALSLGNVPRVALSSWTDGELFPDAVEDLKARLQELQDRRRARKQEVGLRPELESIVSTIEYDYDEAKLIRQVGEYRKKIAQELI